MRVRGIGPRPCDFMCVSDYPGQKEAAVGIPLVGKTGREVDRFLDGMSLPLRDDIFLCNLIREWNESNEYAMADVERDEAELENDLRTVNPRLIFTLGRWSARWFLGDVDLDEVEAIPWKLPEHRRWKGAHEDVTVFPIYNPAAGFRNPEVQAHVTHGFHELALFVDGKTEARELFKDAHPNPVYLECPDDPAWLRALLSECKVIHIDSEGHPFKVWSVQFAVQPGTAYMIRMTSRRMMEAFFRWLVTAKPKVVYHGSLHDFSIMRVVMQQLGIPIDRLYDIEFDDTQIMAYLLQLEPIGLKPNCVRHCNMKMQSFDEVMGDAQYNLAVDYLVALFDAEQRKYEAAQRAEFELINRTPLIDAKTGLPKKDKAGNIKYRRTTVMPKLPRTDLHKAAERVMRSREPYKLWQDQREDILVAAYNTEIP